MQEMSSNDSYDDEPRPSGRRAAREPAGPAKVQGSTAAAILILVAIVGFGVGALVGNAGGDDGTTAEEQDPASVGSPNDQNDSEGEEADEESDIAVTLEMDDSAAAGEELQYRVFTDPPQPGLVLGVERRMPGGDWEPFGDPQVQAEIGDDGEDEGHVITGRTGESEWRVAGEVDGERVESNVITATITEEGGGDDNGRGNGNGNGNGDDD